MQVIPIVNVFAVIPIVNNTIPIVNQTTVIPIVNNTVPTVNITNRALITHRSHNMSLYFEVHDEISKDQQRRWVQMVSGEKMTMNEVSDGTSVNNSNEDENVTACSTCAPILFDHLEARFYGW